MLLAVSVHAAGDTTLIVLHPERAFPCALVRKAPTAGTADKTSTVLAKAPIRSRPPDRSVRATGRGPGRQISGKAPGQSVDGSGPAPPGGRSIMDVGRRDDRRGSDHAAGRVTVRQVRRVLAMGPA